MPAPVPAAGPGAGPQEDPAAEDEPPLLPMQDDPRQDPVGPTHPTLLQAPPQPEPLQASPQQVGQQQQQEDPQQAPAEDLADPQVGDADPQDVPGDLDMGGGEAGAEQPGELEPTPEQDGLNPAGPTQLQADAQQQQIMDPNQSYGAYETGLLQASHSGMPPPQMSMQAMLHGSLVQSGQYLEGGMMPGADGTGAYSASFGSAQIGGEQPQLGDREAMGMYNDIGGLQNIPQDALNPVVQSAAPFQVGFLSHDPAGAEAVLRCAKHCCLCP